MRWPSTVHVASPNAPTVPATMKRLAGARRCRTTRSATCVPSGVRYPSTETQSPTCGPSTSTVPSRMENADPAMAQVSPTSVTRPSPVMRKAGSPGAWFAATVVNCPAPRVTVAPVFVTETAPRSTVNRDRASVRTCTWNNVPRASPRPEGVCTQYRACTLAPEITWCSLSPLHWASSTIRAPSSG